MLQIGVLGPLRVEVDGAPADLGGPRQRAVLLRLLVGQGSSVSVDRLLTDLYEGAPPPSALSGLQAYVSHVRRTLEPHLAQRAAPAGPSNTVFSTPTVTAIGIARLGRSSTRPPRPS